MSTTPCTENADDEVTVEPVEAVMRQQRMAELKQTIEAAGYEVLKGGGIHARVTRHGLWFAPPEYAEYTALREAA